MAEQGSPRYLLALHPEGGAPEGVSFVGPRLRKGAERMLGGAGEGTVGLFDHVAVSPDGEWTYVSVGPNSRFSGKRNGVLRLKWSDKESGALWLGKDESGADDEHFNTPEGLAVDKAGNLYVCDWGNNRVMVFSAEGQLLGKFPADKPQQIAVHPASGEIFILSCTLQPKWGRLWGEESVLRKLSPWGKDAPKELAKLDAKGMSVMALDPAASPARLWIAGRGLFAVTDKGAQLEVGPVVSNDNSMHHPTYIAGDPARNRALIYENGEVSVYQVDLATGRKSPFCKGTYVTLDREGNVYVMGGRDNAVYRFDPSGKPLAFAGTGSNKIVTKGYRGFGPNMGMPGIAVDLKGNLYVSRNSNYGQADAYGGRVDLYGPDGKLVKENLIDGLGYGDCGLGLDAAGNLYLGINVKPADKPFPAAFMGKVPAKGWTYWRGAEREAPWCYVYYNSYLWHWGSVFKFGPAGGAVYGEHPWNLKDAKYGAPKPTDKLENAPADAASYRSAYLGYEVKVAGAMWRYPGCGIIPSSGDGLMPDPGCACYNSQLAADEYGRVFAPNPFRYSVEMLDTNGNQLARIGRYGNADCAGPGSRFPEPEIAFASPGYVSTADGKVFVTDTTNRRVVVVRFDPAAAAECAAP
jgi:sugar lactone lactonase YvrE